MYYKETGKPKPEARENQDVPRDISRDTRISMIHSLQLGSLLSSYERLMGRAEFSRWIQFLSITSGTVYRCIFLARCFANRGAGTTLLSIYEFINPFGIVDT